MNEVLDNLEVLHQEDLKNDEVKHVSIDIEDQKDQKKILFSTKDDKKENEEEEESRN